MIFLVSDNEDYLDYTNFTSLQKKLEPLNKNNDNQLNNFTNKYGEDQPIRNGMSNEKFINHFDDLAPLNTNLDLDLVQGEPDFVMNSRGRLTEIKSVKTTNNVHDYLYSLSKKENDGYVDKYKEEQHRKATDSKKRAYKPF